MESFYAVLVLDQNQKLKEGPMSDVEPPSNWVKRPLTKLYHWQVNVYLVMLETL